MMVAVFARKGTGGRVLVGYREIARVVSWEYTPNPGGQGEGTVAVILAEVHGAYQGVSDVTLELQGKAGVLRWPSAELLSDECLVVPGPPA